ncbi:MAG TPA: cytoplasmic protein [Blastocatellia bacterium]|nr:cytoplasmic protein [Blastocatellia bacterium]
MSDITILTETADPTIIASGQYRVLMENERVRVPDYRSRPGEQSIMHWHPACLVYVIRPAKMLITTPDGLRREVDLLAGELLWRDDMSHAVASIGNSETHLLVIELKDQARSEH